MIVTATVATALEGLRRACDGRAERGDVVRNRR